MLGCLCGSRQHKPATASNPPTPNARPRIKTPAPPAPRSSVVPLASLGSSGPSEPVIKPASRQTIIPAPSSATPWTAKPAATETNPNTSDTKGNTKAEGYYCVKCEGVFREARSPQMTMGHNHETGMPDIKFHGKNNTKHHSSYDALRRSMRSGCRLCVVLMGELDLQRASSQLEADLRFTKPIHFEIQTGMLDMDAFQLYFVVETLGRGNNDRDRYEITLRAQAVRGRFSGLHRDSLVDLVSSQPLSSYTGSPKSLNLAKGWLRACNDDHTICQGRPPQEYFPTRVLDVGLSMDSNTIRLFIPPTKSSSPFEPYITLSHQWGASEKTSPILKRKNLTRLCQSIDIATLPRVFRDAIHLTRLFGIRYIWIDRLCIIQDSEADWSHEAQLMQQVYASSCCSIAASDADDPSKGCFFDRCPEVVTPWRRMLKDSEDPNEDGEGDEYVLVPGSGVMQGFENGGNCNWRKPLTKSSTSLYRRGWVLQESILAPRILHCSNRQLYWECPSAVCCETFPTGLLEQFWVLDDFFQMRRRLAAPAAGYAHLHFRSKSSQTGESSAQREKETADAPMPLSHKTWLRTVETYTRCQLTFPKDKLIAISGIAGAFLPSLGTYCLGLWKDHLPMGLLWSLDSPPSLMTMLGLAAGPKPRKTPYRAPSWSWASVDGPVTFYSNTFADGDSELSGGAGFRTVINVLDVATETRYPDGLGEVMPRTRASLLLEGGLVRVGLGLCEARRDEELVEVAMVIVSVGDEKFNNYNSDPASGHAQDFEMDQILTLLVGGSAMEGMGRTRVQEQGSIVVLDDEPANILVSSRGELWCLPILVKDLFGVWSVDGILLAKSLGVPKDLGVPVHRRVGYFSASGQDSPGLRMFQGLEQEPIIIV